MGASFGASRVLEFLHLPSGQGHDDDDDDDEDDDDDGGGGGGDDDGDDDDEGLGSLHSGHAAYEG